MWIKLQNKWRTPSIFITIIILLISLFISRAVLSIATAAFVALCFFHNSIWQQLRSFFRSPFLVSISLLFFIPLLSGCWSSNTSQWLAVLRVKLPLLLFPIAFAGAWQLSVKQWRIIAYCFLLLICMACCWSFFQYMQDSAAINESYLRAKTIPVLLGNDHVRFSWLVSIAVATAALLISKETKTAYKTGLIALLLFFVLYIHVLSARTGLILTYLFLFCWTINMVIQQGKSWFIILAGVVIVSVASWYLFPTLQNRLRYNRYDLSFVLTETYLPGTSDGNRALSIKAGRHTLQQHPWAGVGAGDVWDTTRKWYATHVQGMLPADQLYPSSEWLVYGNIAGWPGLILFTICMLIPLCIKIPNRFFLVMLQSMAAMGFLIETSLEIQYGVFIYAFTILWWWKWLQAESKRIDQ
jgi:O-antigen ligase